MKFKVTYYDIETDRSVTKDCLEMSSNIIDDNFSFTPVDNPVKIYKSITIDRPVVSICQTNIGLRICVRGYQAVNSGGYYKMTTVIESVNEE